MAEGYFIGFVILQGCIRYGVGIETYNGSCQSKCVLVFVSLAMACHLLKLRVTSMAALFSRQSSLASLCSPNKLLVLKASRKWSPRASIRCMSTVDSSASASSSLTPLERLRQRQMRDAVKLQKLNPPMPEPRVMKETVPGLVRFNDLGLSDEVMEAVKELGLMEPTEVQAIGIPTVLAGENVVMASHTGSGKTLAYLLPIVQVLSLP